MPSNLYGPHDNYSLRSGQVIPALIRKFHDAKVAGSDVVEIWGTGTPCREFLHVDDLAVACLFLLEHYDGIEHGNIGSGVDVSIREVASLTRDIIAHAITLDFDTSKPDGAPRKLLDINRLKTLGWASSISLTDGLASTYEWYLNNHASARGVDEH